MGNATITSTRPTAGRKVTASPRPNPNRAPASKATGPDTEQLSGLILDVPRPEAVIVGRGKAPNPMDPEIVANLTALASNPQAWAVWAGTNFDLRSVLKSTANKWIKQNTTDEVTYRVRFTTVTEEMLSNSPHLKARVKKTDLGKPSADKDDNNKRTAQIYFVEEVPVEAEPETEDIPTK